MDSRKTQPANSEHTTQSPKNKTTPVRAAKSSEEKIRTYTEADAERLRSEIDLGDKTFSQQKPDGMNPVEPTIQTSVDLSEKAEEGWRQRSRALQQRLNDATTTYRTLDTQCKFAQGASIAGALGGWNMRDPNRPKDETGNEMTRKEYADRICLKANQAKSAMDNAQQDWDAFIDDAHKKGIPPGWTGTQ